MTYGINVVLPQLPSHNLTSPLCLLTHSVPQHGFLPAWSALLLSRYKCLICSQSLLVKLLQENRTNRMYTQYTEIADSTPRKSQYFIWVWRQEKKKKNRSRIKGSKAWGIPLLVMERSAFCPIQAFNWLNEAHQH